MYKSIPGKEALWTSTRRLGVS